MVDVERPTDVTERVNAHSFGGFNRLRRVLQFDNGQSGLRDRISGPAVEVAVIAPEAASCPEVCPAVVAQRADSCVNEQDTCSAQSSKAATPARKRLRKMHEADIHARWLLGQVSEVMPHAVRLRCLGAQTCCADGSDVFDGTDFVAPICETEPSLLDKAGRSPYINPTSAGYWEELIYVKFLEDLASGRGPAGEPRAKRVKPLRDAEIALASRASTPRVQAPSTARLCMSLSACFLKLDRVNNGVLGDEWKSLRTVAAKDALINLLVEEAARASAVSDGLRLCDVVLRAVGGLGAPPTDRAQVDSNSQHQFRLRSLLLQCMSGLDLADGVVRKRVGSALSHIWALSELACKSQLLAQEALKQWELLFELVRPLTLTPDEVQNGIKLFGKVQTRFCVDVGMGPCSVPGCARNARRDAKWMEADNFGPAGFRCYSHSPRALCNVAGCGSLKSGRVNEADTFGEPGFRCIRHGARQCNVQDCTRMAVARCMEADDFGPPGRRCFQHGPLDMKRCEVIGCTGWPKRWTRSTDEFGPPGMRCFLHGSQRCTTRGCKRLRWGVVHVADQWGEPGSRCHLHGGVRCVIEGCSRQPVRKVVAEDVYGPPGARCEAHSKPHVSMHPGSRPRRRSLTFQPPQDKGDNAETGVQAEPAAKAKPKASARAGVKRSCSETVKDEADVARVQKPHADDSVDCSVLDEGGVTTAKRLAKDPSPPLAARHAVAVDVP